jgi:acyl transferase domain-containing protein
MAAPLYEAFPAYRQAVDECLSAIPDPGELRHLLLAAAPGDAEAGQRLRDTSLTQPALFVVEYAVAALLRSLGIAPLAMLGHSLGEYVAAVVAGVLSPDDGMRLVSERARMMAALPAGGMAAVPLSAEAVTPYLEEGVGVAAVNAPELVTLSGPVDVLERVVARLEADSMRVRRLTVSHAFHSIMMDAVLDDYRAVLAKIEFHPPKVRYVSNVTGGWITEAECTDPEYWVRHLREPVQFAAGCATLARESDLVVLDAGPGTPLLAMLGLTPGASWAATAGLHADIRKRGDGVRTFLQAVGTAWTAGIDVDFARLWRGTRRKRVPLPTYPFEHQRYWLSPSRAEQAPAPRQAAAVPVAVAPSTPVPPQAPVTREGRYPRPDISTPYAQPRSDVENYVTGAMAEILGFERVGVHDNFFEFDADSLMALQLATRLRDRFGIELPVTHVFENSSAARLSQLVEKEVEQTGGSTARRDASVGLEALARGASPHATPAAPLTTSSTADSAVDDILRDADPIDLARLLNEIEGER